MTEIEIFRPRQASLSSVFALTDGQETLVPLFRKNNKHNGQMSHSPLRLQLHDDGDQSSRQDCSPLVVPPPPFWMRPSKVGPLPPSLLSPSHIHVGVTIQKFLCTFGRVKTLFSLLTSLSFPVGLIFTRIHYSQHTRTSPPAGAGRGDTLTHPFRAVFF